MTPRTSLLVFLALLVFGPGLRADDFRRQIKKASGLIKSAGKDLQVDVFMMGTRTLLDIESAKTVRVVIEGYAPFGKGQQEFEPGDFYAFYSGLVRRLGRLTDAKALKEIERQLQKAKSPHSRVLVLDTIAVSQMLDIRRAALVALGDPSPVVVRRSLRYLRNARELDVVDAVLERFVKIDSEKYRKKEAWERTRLAFADALTSILGVRLRLAADYQSYLQPRRNRKDLFDPKDVSSDRQTRLSLFGSEISGKNIVFLLDVSGSMNTVENVKVEVEESGTVVRGSAEHRKLKKKKLDERRRMTRMKKELIKVVKALPEDVRFNVISFSTDVSPWRKQLVSCEPKARKSALEYIEKMKPEGLTVTDWALESAFADVAVDTIYLVTDGAPTHEGAAGKELPLDSKKLMKRILHSVKTWNFLRGVRIFTLGFPEAEQDFLEKLAAENWGRFHAIQ